MKKIAGTVLLVALLFPLPPTAAAQEETERNGFFLRPTVVFSGDAGGDPHYGNGWGGGLIAGGNFARGWICGIQGGVTYTSYSSATYAGPLAFIPVTGTSGMVDIFFDGIVGWSLKQFDLFANLGTLWSIIEDPYGGWDPFFGIKVGGNADYWILDWLAVGISGNFLWSDPLEDIFSGSGRLDPISRYSILLGPKFRF
jgi:hypothetical protein